MNARPNALRVLLVIALLLLVALAWTGLSGGLDQFPRTQTIGQEIQSAAQFAYGLFSVLSIVVVFWAPRWTRVVVVIWALSLTLAGGLAPIVWGDSAAVIGVLSGAATLLIALGIIWLLRTGARGLTRA